MMRLLENGSLKTAKQNGVETAATSGLEQLVEAFEKIAGMRGLFLQTVVVP